MELTDDWTETEVGRYYREPPKWASLWINPRRLAPDANLDRFSQSVRDHLGENLDFSPSLFEIISTEETRISGHPARRIRYRMQQSSHCVQEFEEILVVSELIEGRQLGFRIGISMCEDDFARESQTREQVFESFQITTRPAQYYTQFLPVRGVMVKAHESVDPAAVQAGADILEAMLSGRKDISECMSRENGDLAIIPRDQPISSIPEYAHMEGKFGHLEGTGSYGDILGTRGQGGPDVASSGEEQLLGNWEPHHDWYPFRGLVATHEYAHAIQNICFTQEDWERWRKFYAEALNADLYPGTHTMQNDKEFFAAFTQMYFDVSAEAGYDDVTREDLRVLFPRIYLALDEIYGGAVLPEIYRIKLPPPTSEAGPPPNFEELPQADRPALVAFYNAMGGPNWAENTNWLSDAHIAHWHGVTIGPAGRVITLNLPQNGLRGVLPPELGELTELKTLSVWANALSGPVPPELAGLTKLEELGVGGNGLSGEIPDWLGNLSNLRSLHLVSNSFSGQIPSSLGELPLRGLYLNSNLLSGDVPAQLGHISTLQSLYLADNDLTGCIPEELRDVPDNDFAETDLPFCGQ